MSRIVDVRTLREPPVVGRYYLVPTIRYAWFEEMREWPVFGPLHHDREINFPWLHFHIDARFLPARYDERVEGGLWSASSQVNGAPISENAYYTSKYGQIPRKAELRRWRCRRSTWRWLASDEQTKSWPFKAKYGDPAPAIERTDGRQLCPHRKVDLSQFPADDDGIVICPVHGLRVRCQRADQRVAA